MEFSRDEEDIQIRRIRAIVQNSNLPTHWLVDESYVKYFEEQL